MKKKKLYTTGIEEGIDGWRSYIQIDQQTLYLIKRDTKEEAQWYRKQVEIALDRLILKAKEEQK